MKRALLPVCLLIGLALSGQESGYAIKVTVKPFKNQYVYLGHYFGKSYPIIDSAMLNANSQAVFKGKNRLNGGIYLVGYPGRNGFFEILVDKKQHFSVIADTATVMKKIQFINSPDNQLFSSYQQYMNKKGVRINQFKQLLSVSKNATDSLRFTDSLKALDKEVLNYRLGLIKKNPGSILSALLQCMREPELPRQLENPKNQADSTAAWQYYKQHYWDGVSFFDSRLAYTTFFEDKLDKYMNQLVVPHPDSVIRELDWMIGYSAVAPEMNRFLLIKFVNRYLNQKYMWEDKVFLHLYEKYFAQKKYSWLTDQGEKIITDRAYSLMANIIGTEASDVELPDTSGQARSLYKTEADYTVVVFWDATCGHCKEVIPQVDSLYRAKWKAQGVKIFAISKETNGTRKDWLDFIGQQRLEDWVNVFYSKADEKARVDNGVPGYSQLYDIQTFPTLYLLDKQKRIVAKKLGLEQIDDVLQLKIRGGN